MEWMAWQAQQRWRSSAPTWGPGLATTRTLGILSTKTAKPWRLELGMQFPLFFADGLGTSYKVSGVFEHGWCSTFYHGPPSPQIFSTYPKQELLCLPVILFPSSQMKRSLLAICLLFGFLSRNETEGNRNSAPSHVTSPCKEAHLLLFAPKTTTPEVNDCH